MTGLLMDIHGLLVILSAVIAVLIFKVSLLVWLNIPASIPPEFHTSQLRRASLEVRHEQLKSMSDDSKKMPGVKRHRDGAEKLKDNDVQTSPFMPMFEVFRNELDEHHDRRERIIKASRDITAASKKM